MPNIKVVFQFSVHHQRFDVGVQIGKEELIANIIPQSANRIKLTILDSYIAEQFKPVFKSKVVKHMVSQKKRVSVK